MADRRLTFKTSRFGLIQPRLRPVVESGACSASPQAISRCCFCWACWSSSIAHSAGTSRFSRCWSWFGCWVGLSSPLVTAAGRIGGMTRANFVLLASLFVLMVSYLGVIATTGPLRGLSALATAVSIVAVWRAGQNLSYARLANLEPPSKVPLRNAKLLHACPHVVQKLCVLLVHRADKIAFFGRGRDTL